MEKNMKNNVYVYIYIYIYIYVYIYIYKAELLYCGVEINTTL